MNFLGTGRCSSSSSSSSSSSTSRRRSRRRRRITVSILIAVVVGVVVAVAAAARFNGLLRSIGLLEGRAQEQGAATFGALTVQVTRSPPKSCSALFLGVALTGPSRYVKYISSNLEDPVCGPRTGLQLFWGGNV